MAVILAAVVELMYYYSSPNCTAECKQESHNKI